MAVHGFQQIAEREADEPQAGALTAQAQKLQAQAVQQQAQAAQMLVIALKALGQRALVALSSLFTAATVASAWWLWLQVAPDPSARQLVGVGLYGVFILALHLIRGRPG